MRDRRLLLRALTVLLVAVSSASVGCRSVSQTCCFDDPCGCPTQSCCPQESCCPQQACGTMHVEVVEECCEPERWWKKLGRFGKKKDSCCEESCGRTDWESLNRGSSECCQQQECGPGCRCTPRRYLGCYDCWRDKRAVISAADDCACEALDQVERQQGKVCREFCCGFRKGYQDVALGGDGRVPAVPPKSYWQASARTERGHYRAARWFEGYELGARYALNDGQQPYRRIATPRVQPSDAPHVPPYHGEEFTPNGPIEGANPYPPPSEPQSPTRSEPRLPPPSRLELPAPGEAVGVSWQHGDETPVDAVQAHDELPQPTNCIVNPPLWPY